MSFKEDIARLLDVGLDARRRRDEEARTLDALWSQKKAVIRAVFHEAVEPLAKKIGGQTGSKNGGIYLNVESKHSLSFDLDREKREAVCSSTLPNLDERYSFEALTTEAVEAKVRDFVTAVMGI